MPLEKLYTPLTERYSPEVLPEVISHRFGRLLRAADISYEGFTYLSAEQLLSPLFEGSDTPL